MSNQDVVERELTAIWNAKGRLTPPDVVEAATVEDHPLHAFFLWNDTEAAHKYRVVQAAGLIRSVKVRITTEHAGEIEDFKIRAWLPARAAGALSSVPPGYMPESEVRNNPEARNALLRQMMRDLQTFKRRYSHLAEFWGSLTELVQEHPDDPSDGEATG